MPTRSDSASANAPLERIKRIKDIAACRKEEVEKHGNDIRQQALERSAFRANNPNVKSTNQKPTMAEIRESKKEAFAEEFSKMGCLKCYDEGSKRVGGRTGIRKGRLDSNLEEGSKSHQSKHSAEHAPKPRWNYGTSTSKITESNHLYGYHEPFINNFKQKQVASLKDGGVNEQQSKSKPSVKNTGHRQIPVIQSLIMEDKRNNTDTALENRIPRHTSEPHMTLPSKRSAPSTKIHREKCCVFQATDIPNNDNICVTTKDRKAKAVFAVTDKQYNNTLAKDKKPSEVQQKAQKERQTDKDKTIEVKEETESKTNKTKLFKSKIPSMSKAHTAVDNSLGLKDTQNLRDNQCQCQCHCKSNVTTVAMPESVEPERESSNPPRKVTEAKKSKIKIPFRKRPGTPRQK